MSSPSPAPYGRATGLANGTILIGFALFAFILLARVTLIANAGNDIPFFDQWEGEAKILYHAWETGAWTWRDFLRPHNEHRLLATQVLNVSLLSLNSQWDPLVQMVAGACLSAFTAAALMVWVARGLSGFQKTMIALAIAVFFLPIASWHNTLWGFQSQVYFTLGLSVIAMWGWTTEGSHHKARLAVALVATLVALVSSGTVVFLGVALVGGGIESALSRRRLGARTLYLVIGGLFVLVAAWLLRPAVPGHSELRATDWASFMSAWTSALAWPETRLPALSFVLMNLPWLVLVGGRVSGRISPTLFGDRAVMLGLWSIAAAAGQAWARGGAQMGGAGIPSRYVDFLIFLPLANVLAACELYRRGLGQLRLARCAFAVFAFFLLSAWVSTSASVWEAMIIPRKQDRFGQSRLVGEVVETRSGDALKGQPWTFIPHFDATSILSVVDDAVLQPILPPSLQRVSPFQWLEGDEGLLRLGAVPGGVPRTGRYSAWGTFISSTSQSRTGETLSKPFRFDGYAGELSLFHTGVGSRTSVVFVDQNTGRETSLSLTDIPPYSWENVTIRIPPGIYGLRVRNERVQDGVALTALRPMGPLSWATRRLLGISTELLWVSAGALFVLLTLIGLDSRPSPKS
ncbi:MAG TPA: hypothetical protein PLN52_02070 [Opitutaceae bacterium]|nr:hypothetical protein [Opitutaceae bacterium]